MDGGRSSDPCDFVTKGKTDNAVELNIFVASIQG